jgi:hypothetical protein
MPPHLIHHLTLAGGFMCRFVFDNHFAVRVAVNQIPEIAFEFVLGRFAGTAEAQRSFLKENTEHAEIRNKRKVFL